MLGIQVVEWWITLARVRDLPDLPQDPRSQNLPTVCLCIPARNEALEVGPALDSWLAQDYPRLSIVVVDDGSTDGTSEILESRRSEKLRVIHNDHLPEGWLGKNHAVHLAVQSPEAQQADWLLFADADGMAAPDLLRRVFAFMEQFPGDFISLWPAMETHTFWERLLVPQAEIVILWGAPPRRVCNPQSRRSFGAGAFFLVCREAYEAVGGHAAAPMEPIDDIMLARRLKAMGFLNLMAAPGPSLRLRAIHNLQEGVDSLRKNILGFKGVWFFTPLLFLLTLALFLTPLWLALLGHAWAGLISWLLVPPMLGTLRQRLAEKPVDLVWALWPLAGLVVAWILLLAFLDRIRGVNRWRGREVGLNRR
jgi:glycosyltransferase involved in cell wall biosynthesis